MPNAKKFKRWVTSEVLPAIRKHGLYATDDLIARTLRNVVIEATLSTEVEYIQVKFVWRDDVIEGVGI